MQIVVQPVSMVPLTFSYGIAGNQLQLSWPITHKGWRLEVQTNLVAGLGTNWFSIPGSSGTNQMFFPLSPTNPSVFFRLAYP
jgi:hypothetical protein